MLPKYKVATQTAVEQDVFKLWFLNIRGSLGFSFPAIQIRKTERAVHTQTGLVHVQVFHIPNTESFSSAVSAGFIPWSDVLEINEKTIMGQHYLRVKVKKPELYIERQFNGLKRFLMRRNHKSFDAAVSISASLIRCSIEELKDLLDRRFAAYKADVGN